ncbi:phosphatase PAP2 family protein [Enterococcus faecalis]|uniref:phosphatase PAP2/LCP family protein n=1 Tax=Enterococcus faecalis TaxID=1351 RepID=UPI0010CD059D|nr:phosphatase PAP2/LCP family protein [Enterococcus faecalis]QCR02555.1 phosphatase PAP2 family protein [Enterococcus faecalis]
MQTSTKKFPLYALTTLGFTFLTLLVAASPNWFQQMDEAIYHIKWQLNAPLLTAVNLLAKTATIGPMLLFFLLLMVYLLRKKEKILAFWAVSNLLAVGFLGSVFKHVVGRARPNLGALADRSSASFPSGHSLLAMALVCTILIILAYLHVEKTKGIKIFLLTYLVLIVLGRLILRVHYPSDVIAGMLLSYSWINFSFQIVQRYLPAPEPEEAEVPTQRRRRHSRKRKSLFVVFSLTLLFLGTLSVSAYGVSMYRNLQKTANTMYKPRKSSTKSPDLAKGEPVSFLIMGIANDSKRKTDYRSNALMVVTVNNQLQKTTITSIPRDYYVEMAGTNGEYNKINAAHVFGGADMQIKTVENVLHIPINHYFSIDMDAMKDLGDAVGGVTVDNAFAFDAEGIHYPKGKQHLGGWEALQYARMRYEDPEGDYGRQRRQREVLIELTNKLLSFNSLLKYQEILDVIGEHGETDLSFDQMMAMLKKYTPALKTIETDQLKGYDYTGDGVTGIESISYQLVEESERQRVENAIKEQMNLSTKDTEQSQ